MLPKPSRFLKKSKDNGNGNNDSSSAALADTAAISVVADEVAILTDADPVYPSSVGVAVSDDYQIEAKPPFLPLPEPMEISNRDLDELADYMGAGGASPYPHTVASPKSSSVTSPMIASRPIQSRYKKYTDYEGANKKTSPPSSLLSPRYEQDIENGRDTDEPTVVFVTAPILGFVNVTCDNVVSLQANIDLLRMYLDRLTQSSMRPIGRYFLITDKHSSTTLDYAEIMEMILRYPVSARHYQQFSDMIHNYYISLIQNLDTLAYIMVNACYTVNRTHSAHILTHFINYCASNMVKRIMDVMSLQQNNQRRPDPLLQSKLLYAVREKQNLLMNYYNFNLINLTARHYLKFTPDNGGEQTAANGSTEEYYQRHQQHTIIDNPLYVTKINVSLDIH